MTYMLFCNLLTFGPRREVDADCCIKPGSQCQPRLNWGRAEGWGDQLDASFLSNASSSVNQRSDFWGPFYQCRQSKVQVHDGEAGVLELGRRVNLLFPLPFIFNTLPPRCWAAPPSSSQPRTAQDFPPSQFSLHDKADWGLVVLLVMRINRLIEKNEEYIWRERGGRR